MAYPGDFDSCDVVDIGGVCARGGTVWWWSCLSEWLEFSVVLLVVPTAEFIGVMKKADKFVDELLAEIIGVFDAERPSTGEFGRVKLLVGEFGLLFFNFC